MKLLKWVYSVGALTTFLLVYSAFGFFTAAGAALFWPAFWLYGFFLIQAISA